MPVDRARQVAAQYRSLPAGVRSAVDELDAAQAPPERYRSALLALADACDAIDQAAAKVGEGWIVPQLAVELPGDLVTVPRAAELVGRSVRWAYWWASDDREHRVKASDPMRVRLGDVQAAVAEERGRRAGGSGT